MKHFMELAGPLRYTLVMCLLIGMLSHPLLAENPKETALPPITWSETPEQHDQRMQWWREARFGMFIHWGIYSAAGGFWNNQRIPGMGEWLMCLGKISPQAYQEFANSFNPVDFDADRWVGLAQEAGMKYMVVTAKHHDGFAMFETKYSPHNIVTGSAYKKDPLQALAQSCDKANMPLGFYYSQALDWSNGGALSTPPWDPTQGTPIPDYIDHVALPQIQELLTHYGKSPRVLWWDWATRIDRLQSRRIYNLTRSLRPEIISNDRLYDTPRDFQTCESHLPLKAPSDHGKPLDWETCMTFNGTWGFRSDDVQWKSLQTLLFMLCDVNSKGGNFLLNIGPDGRGVFPEECVKLLKQVGQWMAINKEAIYGTSRGPFDHPFLWGRTSMKDKTVYAFIFNWPTSGLLTIPLAGQVDQVRLLGSPQAHLTYQGDSNGLTLQLPSAPPDQPVATLAITYHDAPEPLVSYVKPQINGQIILQVGECSTFANILQLNIEKNPTLINWRKATDYPYWNVQITKPGTYEVSALYACNSDRAGTSYSISCGESTLAGKVETTNSFDNFKSHEVGLISIPQAGNYVLKMEMTQTVNDEAVRLQSITLTPHL